MIGIIIREIKIKDVSLVGTRKDLFEAIKYFNVPVIGISITDSWENIKSIVSKCNGIILSGGSELTPNDYKLVKYLYDFDIPTLGICLGMQTMAMTYNNKEEIKVEGHNYVFHDLNINKDTLLYNIIGKDKITVNSRHNYAIAKTNFKVSATSSVIEAIEDDTKKFFLGVQWHPESMMDNNSIKLFKYFLDISLNEN